MLDLLIPRYIEFMTLVCMRTKAKTTISVGTARRVIARNRRLKKSGEMLTVGKREGHLSNRESLFNVGKT